MPGLDYYGGQFMSGRTFSHNQIEATVRAFIVENFLLGDDSSFQNDTSLLEGGVLDSTGAVELVQFLEDEFSLEIGDKEITRDNLDSVDRICAFVERKCVVPLRT
jgi:acyl carrier protein